MDQTVGGTTLGAETFFENVGHQLANAYLGSGSSRSLRITDVGGASMRGLGLHVGHRFGGVLNGSVSYRYGHSTWEPRPATPSADAVLGEEGDFHDVTTRVETSIDGTGTRVVAFYRIVHVSTDGEGPHRVPATNHRFDVQLSQGLPFVGRITRADWDFLFAVRNLFYESDGAVLDELAVVNPRPGAGRDLGPSPGTHPGFGSVIRAHQHPPPSTQVVGGRFPLQKTGMAFAPAPVRPLSHGNEEPTWKRPPVIRTSR